MAFQMEWMNEIEFASKLKSTFQSLISTFPPFRISPTADGEAKIVNVLHRLERYIRLSFTEFILKFNVWGGG